MITIKIDSNIKERLDKYLTESLEFTRSQIKNMIADGQVLVNDEVVKATYNLKIDDVITIDDISSLEADILPENIPLDIIFEDEDVCIVNKPSDMVVHPAAGHSSGTLVNALMYHCQNNLSDVNGAVRPGIVHRIDKDTSGLLLVAKNNYAHNHLAEQLKNKTITRVYTALVAGVIKPDSGKIDAPIGRDENDRKRQAVTEHNSREAVTNFKVTERFKNSTLIECRLETGRTHQIRVHLKYIEHHVLNDPLYSRKTVVPGFGQLLHATTIGFIHPRTNQYMEFTVPVPKIFNDYIEELRNEQ